MKIKSLFLIALLSGIFVLSANAQVGIQAGYVNSTFKTSPSNMTYNGFNAGVTYDMPFAMNFSLRTGLLYSLILDSQELSIAIASAKVKSSGHFLTLPINVAYNVPLGDFSVFLFAGPNLVLGVAGKNKVESDAGNIGSEFDYNWYSDNDNRNRFDIQIGAGAGIQYNQIRLKVGFDWGLLNLSDAVGGSLKRNQLSISLGYLF